MTIGALSHAMFARAPYPLAKLVLMRFADGCDGTGQIHPDAYAEFCCASSAEVAQAVSDLVTLGFLKQLGPDWYSLDGYTPFEFPSRKPTYVKRVLPKMLKAKVMARDGFACKHCGSEEHLTIDHIKPERHGGTDDMENLQTLCRPCNSRKGPRHG